MTPQRRHLGKAVARRSKKAIAAECMKDRTVKGHVLTWSFMRATNRETSSTMLKPLHFCNKQSNTKGRKAHVA